MDAEQTAEGRLEARFVICHDCGGEGIWDVPTGPYDHINGSLITETRYCKTCGGSGQIEEEPLSRTEEEMEFEQWASSISLAAVVWAARPSGYAHGAATSRSRAFLKTPRGHDLEMVPRTIWRAASTTLSAFGAAGMTNSRAAISKASPSKDGGRG